VAALDALSTSELLQEADQAPVDAVLASLIVDPVTEIERAQGDIDVIEVDDDDDDDDDDDSVRD